MRAERRYAWIPLIPLELVIMCGPRFGQGISATPRVDDQPNYSAWTDPVNLGAPVNTPFVEQGPSISKDGLSLYFASACPGCSGSGTPDIWISHRPSTADPWGPPQPLGPNVNTPSFEGAPYISIDGHRLFFNSDRPGGAGGFDLYVSRRRDAQDDSGWEPAFNLGSGINTAADENQPNFFEDEATGTQTLYYAVGPADYSGGSDIYASTLVSDETWGAGAPVAELNSPFLDRQPCIRRDGLEMFLGSNRPGSFGGLDLWVSTRVSTWDPWSTPVNLGPVVNTASTDARPALLFEGTELYFQSTRGGNFDIYRTSRRKIRGGS